MPHRMNFSPENFKSVIGGLSAIDLPRLAISTLEEAGAFIKVYGFDYENAHDQDRLWYFHRRALVFLDEKLGYPMTEIPAVLQNRKELGDLRKLLLYASSVDPREKELQRWSCAILRVMHVFVHCEMDLFSTFSEEIQKQVLSPLQETIVHDGSTGRTLLQSKLPDGDTIPLRGFETKPFKTSSSTVIKLLARREALAANIYDKLGVRFITDSMFDVFRVVRFLIRESLISTPQILPDQSSNNLYPVNLFLQACQEYIDSGMKLEPKELEAYFDKFLEDRKDEGEFLRKVNDHSANDYRFIKFICRKLIRIYPSGSDKQGFEFYYPFEVQILDKGSYDRHQSGPSEHQAYKERQKQAARERVLPQ